MVVVTLGNDLFVDISAKDIIHVPLQAVAVPALSMREVLQRSYMPVWLDSPEYHLSSSLYSLGAFQLNSCISDAAAFARLCSHKFQLKKIPALRDFTLHRVPRKKELILYLIQLHQWFRDLIRSSSPQNLIHLLPGGIDSSEWKSTTYVAAAIYEQAFGSIIACVMRCPYSTEFTVTELQWRKLDPILDKLYGQSSSKQLANLQGLSAECLRKCTDSIPFCRSSNASNTESVNIHAGFRNRCLQLYGYNSFDLCRLYVSYGRIKSCTITIDVIVFEVLTIEYGQDIMNCMLSSLSDNTLRPIAMSTVYSTLRGYYDRTSVTVPLPCCVCSRAHLTVATHVVNLDSVPFNLELLRSSGAVSLRVADEDAVFYHGHSILDGLVLDSEGIFLNDVQHIIVCDHCIHPLVAGHIPRLSLANHLWRGTLPVEFRDLTWVEEMICSIYRTNAIVARLFWATDEKVSHVLHGNTCAHEMNVASTASILPRTPSNMNDLIAVVFVGSRIKFPMKFRDVFRIRKRKVWAFLLWLKRHNRLYRHIPLDPTAMDLYDDDDGPLPGLEERVVFTEHTDPKDVFSSETAGLDEHPAELSVDNEESCSNIFIDKFGLSDPDGNTVPARAHRASAIRGLKGLYNTSEAPDLVIGRSSDAVSEYNNPDLLPGMFPTLFPYGIGGFEDKSRDPPVSLRSQTDYLLDCADRSFSRHQYFIFVLFNILQRRTAHLQTHIIVSKRNFSSISERLSSITPETLNVLSSILEREGHVTDLTPDQRTAFELLSKVNAIAGNMPGSHAAKLRCRSTIRDYMGFFGIAHIYLTINPNATHSPLFQIFYGDKAVDLTVRYPELVARSERSKRVAIDPVAAADFYEFSVKAIFGDLFGWDFKTRSSTASGGILGHLKAHYGVTELNNRGGLHGHFLLWLRFGLNPSAVHDRMKHDDGYKVRFFEYFDSIIHHHLPDIELPDSETKVNAEFEPRSERPFKPPPENFEDGSFDMVAWQSRFDTDLKRCGEKVQRHRCKKVCHTGQAKGTVNFCRFQFPHELVEQSHFDQDSNSIFLMCKDALVNYHNPHMTVYCRHNHDIKCILSGAAARSAMMYISDYITKFDFKTHQVLTLLSKAVLISEQNRQNDAFDPIIHAKMLLHKCVSQLSSQQQVHAQQAARYLRGHEDGMASHETVVVLSSLAIYEFRKSHENTVHLDESVSNQLQHNDFDEACESEQLSIPLRVDEQGHLKKNNQVMDYMFRDPALYGLTFYAFAQHYSVVPKKKRSARIIQYSLITPHPLVLTHVVTEKTARSHIMVPRILGTKIPRQSAGDSYYTFMLAHFFPWNGVERVMDRETTYETAFKSMEPLSRHREIIDNWEAMYECEDARERERRKQQDSVKRESKLMNNLIATGDMDCVSIYEAQNMQGKDAELSRVLDVLRQSNFLTNPHSPACEQTTLPIFPSVVVSAAITTAQRKSWESRIKQDNEQVTVRRRNQGDTQNQNVTEHPCKVPGTVAFQLSQFSDVSKKAPESQVVPAIDPKLYESAQDLIDAVSNIFTLNKEQNIAFNIIGHRYIEFNRERNTATNPQSFVSKNPLRILLTGPGGTGKTHVAKAQQYLMNTLGCAHRIRTIAPTASAAKTANGRTCHSGLKIKIGHTKKGAEDDHVTLHVTSKEALREDWRFVDVLLIDEVSLLGLQLLAEVDGALRIARENPNDLFGGCHVIFCGDFFQHTPVLASALYSNISDNSAKSTDNELLKRLGKIAWGGVNEVVELTQQNRMKGDPEYAEAVGRLRIGQCTEHDVDLFNSRVVKSNIRPGGIDMGLPTNVDAISIVGTNFVRLGINLCKARLGSERFGHKLVMCAARDEIDGKCVSNKYRGRDLLLRKDMSSVKAPLQGYLPMYVSMPIILRRHNIATELGVTNGTVGIVANFETSICAEGHTYLTCVYVYLPDSTVALPGLPEKVVPIFPSSISFRCSIQLDQGEDPTEVTVKRYQMYLEPAFSMTSHGAQGKTILSILSDFTKGGRFATYVSASRPTTRAGLCLMRTVQLSDLNQPVHIDLVVANKRFEVMQRNTLKKYGYLAGDIEIVPSEESLRCAEQPKSLKRKSEESSSKTKGKSGKRLKPSITKLMPSSNDNQKQPYATWKGPEWDAHNWSCAYDSVLVLMYCCLDRLSPTTVAWFRELSYTSRVVCDLWFKDRAANAIRGTWAVDNDSVRIFREHLNVVNGNAFPLFGRVQASCDRIAHLIFPERALVAHRTFNCSNVLCEVNHLSLPEMLPLEVDPLLIHTVSVHAKCSADHVTDYCSVDNWVSIQDMVNNHQHCGGEISSRLICDLHPPALCLEYFSAENTTAISTKVELTNNIGSSSSYSLIGAIYCGHSHFTAEIIKKNEWLLYDGMIANGNFRRTSQDGLNPLPQTQSPVLLMYVVVADE